jgi:hypothetical protein
MRLDRIVSLVVCLAYAGVFLAFFVWPKGQAGLPSRGQPSSREAVLGVLFFLGYFISALVFFWFGDEIGEISGAYTPWGYMNRAQPGWLVKFRGWVLLLMPGCCGALEALGLLGRFRDWILQ